MRPFELLILLVAILITIVIVDLLYRRRRACLIASIGKDFRMSYSPMDRFAITERLMTSPQWVMRASDLIVKDVLYTSQGGMRCFVATVKCRWSLDQDPSRFVICVLELADHQSDFALRSAPSDHSRDDADLYRKLISEWSSEESTRALNPVEK